METPQRLVFGSIADAYEANRPTYPAAAIADALARAGRPVADLDVADIGAGTGRVTDLLAAAGVTGTIVEPDADMAAIATRKHGAAGWTTIVSDFESAPLAADSLDVITCGQAWHWVDPERGRVKAVDVLRPGGWLVLIWNRPSWHDDALRAELTAIYARLAPDMHSSMASLEHGHKGEPLGTDPPPAGFDHARVDEYWHTITYTTQEWLGVIATHSDHVQLDPSTRDEIFTEVAAVIDRHGGRFDLPHRTEVYSARREV